MCNTDCGPTRRHFALRCTLGRNALITILENCQPVKNLNFAAAWTTLMLRKKWEQNLAHKATLAFRWRADVPENTESKQDSCYTTQNKMPANLPSSLVYNTITTWSGTIASSRFSYFFRFKMANSSVRHWIFRDNISLKIYVAAQMLFFSSHQIVELSFCCCGGEFWFVRRDSRIIMCYAGSPLVHALSCESGVPKKEKRKAQNVSHII